ncbi:hypothetical protein ETI08_01195 [Macrococcoides goetzii]|nr:siphovirus Gp157 family protein [Macrococcus goetzii]TDM47778.1 hypothetical protein ETI08_01195 [Macrococcus goetzii]
MAQLFDFENTRKDLLHELEVNDDMTYENIKDTLDAIEESIDTKLNNTQKMILSLKSEMETADELAKKYQNIKKSKENQINYLKRYLSDFLKYQNVDKKKTSEFTFYFIKRKSIDDHNPELIPEKYWKPQPPKLDKTLIRQDIDKGVEVEGVALIESESLGVR